MIVAFRPGELEVNAKELSNQIAGAWNRGNHKQRMPAPSFCSLYLYDVAFAITTFSVIFLRAAGGAL